MKQNQVNINKIIDELSDLESFEISESGDLIPVNHQNNDSNDTIDNIVNNDDIESVENTKPAEANINENNDESIDSTLESDNTEEKQNDNEVINNDIIIEESQNFDDKVLLDESENFIELDDHSGKTDEEIHIEKAKLVESLINDKLSTLLKLLESEKLSLEQQFNDFCKSLFVEDPCFMNKAKINIHPISEHVEELHQKLMLIQDQNQTLSHKTIMGLAYYYFYSSRYYEGIRLLKDYQNETDQSKINNILGNYYYMMGLTIEAKDFFIRSVKEKDDLIAAHFSLGFIYLNEERYTKALYHLNRAEKNYAENKQLPLLLAESYEHTGQKEKALFFYEKYIEDKQEPLIIEKAAQFSYLLKKSEKALKYFDQAQDLDITIKHIKYKKALCYYLLEQYEESLNQFYELLNETELKSDKSTFEKLYELIKRTFALGIYDSITFEVLEDICLKLNSSYSKAVETDFNTKYIHNNEVLILLAEQFSKLKKYKSSLKFLKKILKNNPKHFPALNELGKIYYKHKHLKDKAIEIFLYLEKLKKTDGEIDFYLGLYYLESDKLDRVIPYLLSAVNKNFKTFDVYKNLGDIYIKQKDFSQAITYYDFASNIDNNNNELNLSLSKAYLEDKQYDKAISLLKDIIANNDNNKEAHYLLSSAYRSILEDKSNEHYSKYLDL